MRRMAHAAVVAIVVSAALLAWVSPVQADPITHVVQPGENLFRIALRYGVTVEALRAANGIAGTTIYVGQKLVIPGKAASEASQASPAAGSTVHVVQRGENLYRIGLKHGVSAAAIQAANGLNGVTIYVGQRLVIPSGGGAATHRAGSAAADAGAGAAPPPAGSGKRIVVDLSDQRLYAYDGDTLVRTTLVSTGTRRTPTVTGTFYIYLRYSSQRMRGPGYDLPGVPYVQYFYKGYGLHGTYWHNNFGTPMSHGCVNLPTEEAEWAYRWASIGTPVIVRP